MDEDNRGGSKIALDIEFIKPLENPFITNQFLDFFNYSLDILYSIVSMKYLDRCSPQCAEKDCKECNVILSKEHSIIGIEIIPAKIRQTNNYNRFTFKIWFDGNDVAFKEYPNWAKNNPFFLKLVEAEKEKIIRMKIRDEDFVVS
jgi:hypothetical protein